jgi:hypothetical protein
MTLVHRPARSEHWKHSGNVWLWRYSPNDRNYPGWHLMANAEGAASLVGLLEALAEPNQPAFRTVQLCRPTPAILAVPKNRNTDWAAPAKLRFAFAETANEWVFTCTDTTAQLTLGLNWLPVFKRAVSRIPPGEGDFSIGRKTQTSGPGCGGILANQKFYRGRPRRGPVCLRHDYTRWMTKVRNVSNTDLVRIHWIDGKSTLIWRRKTL